MKQRIYPPQSWTDFEELCLKLWGILWEIPNEIDYNSTNSQGQNGVDIYGTPKNEKDVFGIQCKNFKPLTKSGKDNKLSIKSIKDEIEKAESFKPKLKHFIIATTLEKDKELEENVRIINIERIKQNKFSVQICFWEFICDKIYDNKNLLNWYTKNQEFLSSKKVSVIFNNKSSYKLDHFPVYMKTSKHYRLETQYDIEKEKKRNHKDIIKVQNLLSTEFKRSYLEKINDFFSNKRKINDKIFNQKILINGIDINSEEYKKSQYPKRIDDIEPKFRLKSIANDLCPLNFQILIKNEGLSVIEDYKLRLFFEGDFESVDTITPKISTLLSKSYKCNVYFNGNTCLIQPEKNFIIQKDYFISDKIQIIPTIGKKSEIKVRWEFISRDYDDKGELLIDIIPKYENSYQEYLVLKENECRTDEVITYKTFEYFPMIDS